MLRIHPLKINILLKLNNSENIKRINTKKLEKITTATDKIEKNRLSKKPKVICLKD